MGASRRRLRYAPGCGKGCGAAASTHLACHACPTSAAQSSAPCDVQAGGRADRGGWTGGGDGDSASKTKKKLRGSVRRASTRPCASCEAKDAAYGRARVVGAERHPATACAHRPAAASLPYARGYGSPWTRVPATSATVCRCSATPSHAVCACATVLNCNGRPLWGCTKTMQMSRPCPCGWATRLCWLDRRCVHARGGVAARCMGSCGTSSWALGSGSAVAVRRRRQLHTRATLRAHVTGSAAT